MAEQNTTRSKSASSAPAMNITGASLVALRERYLEYIAQLQAGEAHLLTFPCPDCGEETRTQAPENEKCWNSMATCPFCGTLYFKVVQHDKAEAFSPAACREARQGGTGV
jgi:predicted RNA-binding Zn-ribbon protein involved in translation (DUF1610 family)